MPLWREKSYPLASPSMAERLGESPSAEKILSMSIIHDSNTEGWRRWLAPDGIEYKPRRQDRPFEDYNLVIDACVQGVGVALARPPLSDAAIAAGGLFPVSQRSVDYHVSYHLVRQDGMLSGPAMEIARRLLQAAGHDAVGIASFTAPTKVKG